MGLALEAGLLAQMESCMLPCNGIFGITAVWAHHLMECRDLVALAELLDVLADFSNVSCNIVALVHDVVLLPFRQFPIFGVCARNDHPNEDLAWFGGGNFHIPNVDGHIFVDDGFFHCGVSLNGEKRARMLCVDLIPRPLKS